MLRQLVKTIRSECSGALAKEHVAEIVQHHRIQASPGIRRAAEYARDTLEAMGVEAELVSAPAAEGISYWGARMFQEWEGRSGTLHLVSPEEEARKLCDFREMPISMIQRSIATPRVEAELVVLDDGTEPEHYEELDVSGKLVLSNADHERVRELAVEQFGALGIVTDGMRTNPPVRPIMEIPDARQYTSFWWYGGETRCFGFVLSQRQGAELRKLAATRAREGKPPVVLAAEVDAEFADGALEIASGLIRGETDEEVVVVAHICHPKPSANDNASGCGAALEAARVIQALVERSELPRPKRGIRFLLLPEMSGSYAYLATHQELVPRMVAGVNLDMVGEDQELCGSSWIIEYPPDASASFVGDLLVRIRDEISGELGNVAGNDSYAPFRHTVSRYSGGSDHYIFCDPSVGVPMPMMIQWPDKFYHTSEDTLDKVDAGMLERVATVTAAYAYFIALAGQRETEWIAREMLARRKASNAQASQELVTRAAECQTAEELSRLRAELVRMGDYWRDRQNAAFASLGRLSAEAGPAVDRVRAAAGAALLQDLDLAHDYIRTRAEELGVGLDEVAAERDQWDERAASMVPTRLVPGPISLRSERHRISEGRRDVFERWRKESRKVRNLTDLALYWTDGERTVAEIADVVEMESGLRQMEVLVGFYELLADVGLVEITEA